MIRNGDVELQAREEDIRFMKMQLTEEKRAIQLLWKNMPGKQALEQELVTLQIQVRDSNIRMITFFLAHIQLSLRFTET